MLVRYGGYRIQSEAVDSNAALEADVMRFMAILGFCLLVVFALVQTLPMQKTQKLQIESEQILQLRLQQLSDKLESLQQQNSALNQYHKKLTGALVKQSLVKTEQRAELQEKLQRQKDKLTQLQSLLSDDRTELSRVRRQLEMSELSVAVLKREFKQLDQGEQGQQSQSQLAEVNNSNEDSVQVQEKRTGFSLHFTDQGAFETLVERGRVSVFYFSKNSSWRVLGVERFVEQILPKTYYQMAAETIPEPLLVAAKQYSSAAQWAVLLDPAMINKIQQIMSENEAGDLAITTTGEVELKR